MSSFDEGSIDGTRARPEGRDAPIVVVSGLPRSGTSLVMSMLGAGGIEVLTDGVRRPDVDNPRGYFELERVKSLAKGSAWLATARGKAVKVVSPLLRHLPRSYRYKILFVRRCLDEVLASQAQMLARRGVARGGDDARLRAELVAHLAETERLLASDPAFEVCYLRFQALLATPDAEIARIASFLGATLDEAAMRASVDPALYRNRSDSQVPEVP